MAWFIIIVNLGICSSRDERVKADQRPRLVLPGWWNRVAGVLTDWYSFSNVHPQPQQELSCHLLPPSLHPAKVSESEATRNPKIALSVKTRVGLGFGQRRERVEGEELSLIHI